MVHKMGLIEVNMPSQTVYLVKYWQYNTTKSDWELNPTKNSNEANATSAGGATDFTNSAWKAWAKTTSSCYLIGKAGAGALPISANRGTSDSYYSWEVSDKAITSENAFVTTTLTPSDVYLKQAWEFSYSGTGQAFTIPAAGTYCFECWGASGGGAGYNGGNESDNGQGGYVRGEILFSSTMTLYIYVGQQGSCANGYLTARFNGGGAGVRSTHTAPSLNGGSGGGATDIRTKQGLTNAQLSSWTDAWNNSYGLSGRIIIAAGGGGQNANSSYQGYAGGLNGGNSSNSSGSTGGLKGCTGATQIKYGVTSSGIVGTGSYSVGNNGSFGQGGASSSSNTINCGGAGGGGYWGGASGGNGVVGVGGAVGSGGSSYISGHQGCIAIASAASTAASTAGVNNSVERATHYSGLVFSNTVMIDGAGYQWTTSAGSQIYVPQTDFYDTVNRETENHGHIGDGFCRITQISVD